MTITPNQAKLILSHSEPLVLNEGLPRPVTEIHVCITPDTLARLGVKEEQLSDYAGGMYDGTDYLHGKERVHVFDKVALEKMSGSLWADYQSSREQAAIAVQRS